MRAPAERACQRQTTIRTQPAVPTRIYPFEHLGVAHDPGADLVRAPAERARGWGRLHYTEASQKLEASLKLLEPLYYMEASLKLLEPVLHGGVAEVAGAAVLTDVRTRLAKRKAKSPP